MFRNGLLSIPFIQTAGYSNTQDKTNNACKKAVLKSEEVLSLILQL